MKIRNIILLFSLLNLTNLFAQGVIISDQDATNISLSPSAILQLQSNHKGLLLPRNELQWYKDNKTIKNPPEGLFFFDTRTKRLVFRYNNRWYGNFREKDIKNRQKEINLVTDQSSIAEYEDIFPNEIENFHLEQDFSEWRWLQVKNKIKLNKGENSIYVHAEGVANIKAKEKPSAFGFAIGIFVDGYLKVVRKFYKEKNRTLCNSKNFDISTSISGLSEGFHDIKVYARNLKRESDQYDYIIYGTSDDCSRGEHLEDFTYLSTEITQDKQLELPKIIYNPKNWMQNLDDDTKLGDISIIGTHDSQNRYGGHRTQNFSIEEQMNAGIRYLDIGLRYYDFQHKFYDGHNHPLSGIIDVISRFLSQNPTETVFLSLNDEDGQTEAFWSLLLDELSGNNILRKYNANTTIGEARGKIVIINRYKYSVDGLMNLKDLNDNGGFSDAYLNTLDFTVYIQDVYNSGIGFGVTSIADKIRFIEETIDVAQKNNRKWVINYFNGTGGYLYPSTVSRSVNKNLNDYLKKYIMRPRGVNNLPINFISKRLGFLILDFALSDDGKGIIDSAIRQSIVANNIYYSELYGLNPMFVPSN